MNYSEITAQALSFADRSDAKVTGNIDNFMRMVESKVNRNLDTKDMSVIANILCIPSDEYYGLPPDFSGLRHIQVQNLDGTDPQSMSFITPEKMAQVKSANHTSYLVEPAYYTIVADQLQIHPLQDETKNIQIVYYKNIPPLTALNTTNWLSEGFPDCYIFGLCVEISCLVKDAEAAAKWELRFNAAISEIDADDTDNRWSGPAMQMRAT